MRDRAITTHDAEPVVGADVAGGRGWLELNVAGAAPAMVWLTEAQLLDAIEALAVVYVELREGRPELAAHVTRTLRNRAGAAHRRRSHLEQRGGA